MPFECNSSPVPLRPYVACQIESGDRGDNVFLVRSSEAATFHSERLSVLVVALLDLI